jgi:bifunctional non-homologous end joining protein LigD
LAGNLGNGSLSQLLFTATYGNCDESPGENPPKIPEKIQWVQPKLVCEVAFAEWTEDEQLRQTTFLGWRDDKDPKEVVLDVA